MQRCLQIRRKLQKRSPGPLRPLLDLPTGNARHDVISPTSQSGKPSLVQPADSLRSHQVHVRARVCMRVCVCARAFHAELCNHAPPPRPRCGAGPSARSRPWWPRRRPPLPLQPLALAHTGLLSICRAVFA